ncbi:hypothetical protein [uncultured Pseudodesulfovibrio sp.]|uniref:hypothetical protein n=1 Tax=uncultured Pseudodesulfovibrio sp. TaxID=2035858 RepID=UPI0029C909FC|nr:hypothetical protein [uncultured Pseudodesulfovibrio sp.]
MAFILQAKPGPKCAKKVLAICPEKMPKDIPQRVFGHTLKNKKSRPPLVGCFNVPLSLSLAPVCPIWYFSVA